MLFLAHNLPREVASVIAALSLCSILYRFYRTFSGPLRHVPGPALARFTRLWEVVKTWKGDFEQTNLALHKRYGKMRSVTVVD